MAPSALWRCEPPPPLLLLLLLGTALAGARAGAPATGGHTGCLEEANCSKRLSVYVQEQTVPFLWEDLPPQELHPLQVKDVPKVLSASPTSLRISLRVAKKRERCPDEVLWPYKKVSQSTESNTSKTTDGFFSDKYECVLNVHFENLAPQTVYMFQATPRKKDYNNKLQPWYDEEDSPRNKYSYPVFARTCSRKVPGIRNLLIHSVGTKWLGLSWIPPEFDCVTELEYRVRYSSNLRPNGYQKLGSFWSNNVHNVSGEAQPCLAWPQRHCALLTHDVINSTQGLVTVVVRRIIDDQGSDPVKLKILSSTLHFAPGPPEELRAEARATALELRWRCPLLVGKRLLSVSVEARSADGRSKADATQLVTLCPAYGLTLQDLKPNTEYNVSVWFVSRIGPGQPASITVRTLAQPTTSTTSSSSTSTSSSTETSTTEASECITTPLPHQQLLVKREDENQWIWTAGCSALLLLVFVAFFVGRRCGERRRGESSGLEKAQSCYGINSKGGAGGGGGAGDKASLCAAAAAGASTPPASVLDYAEVEVEVDLSSQRAWAAVARPGDHYEELPAAPDKPYANIGEQREATNHYYAEVHKPPPPPPPAVKPKPKPTPTPAPTGSAPVYAEVDLQKKHAQRAKH